MTPEALDALATSLFSAFEQNDAAAIQSCCAPDAQLVQNERPPVSLAAMLPTFAAMRDRIGQHRYTNVRRAFFGDGFVEEHDVETVVPAGAAVRLRACVVVRVGDDGRVRELHEYVDPAPLRAATTSAPPQGSRPADDDEQGSKR